MRSKGPSKDSLAGACGAPIAAPCLRRRRGSGASLGLALLVGLLCGLAWLPGSAWAAAGWTYQSSGTGSSLNGVAFSDATHGWVVGDGGTILATTDGGSTWTSRSSGVLDSLYGVASSGADDAWAAGVNGDILATTDRGATWTPQSSDTSDLLMAVAFANADDGWAVGENGIILATTDGGSTWTSQDSGTDSGLRAVAVSGASDAWAVGATGTILATTDGGSRWTSQGTGTSNLYGVSFSDADTGWAVGDNGTILATTDGGSKWSAQASHTSDGLTGVAFCDAETGWATGPSYGTVLATTDGGSTWSGQATDAWYGLAGVACVDASHSWVVGGAGTIYEYRDYAVPTVTLSGHDDLWHASVTADATLDPALSLTEFQYSTDGGSTWNDVPGSGTDRTLPISADAGTSVSVEITDSASQTASDSATVKIDSTTPTITSSGSDNAWHRTPVTLTFTPTVGASGIATVQYEIGPGAWTTITPSAGLYTAAISAEGSNVVSYRVSNNAGTTSDVGGCMVRFDNVRPIAKAKTVTLKAGKVGKLALYVVKKPAGCALAKVAIAFYKGKKLERRFTTLPLEANKWMKISWKCTLAKGTYLMKLTSTDVAGNKQAKATTGKLIVR